MSLGIERERERHGHPHTEEVTGRSIAHAVHQIDELLAAIAAVRALHQPVKNVGACQNTDCPCWKPELVCSCGQHHEDWPTPYPCPTIRALPDLSGDAA